ncbi:MAG: hypothetical protein ACK6EB_22855, partial [Planctomyces sp.]
RRLRFPALFFSNDVATSGVINRHSIRISVPSAQSLNSTTPAAHHTLHRVFVPDPAVTGSRREARDCGLQDRGTGQRHRRPKGLMCV